MAYSKIFTCNHCDFSLSAWDEGNPYMTDNEGKRHFFYHPEDAQGKRRFMARQTMDPRLINDIEEMVAKRDADAESSDPMQLGSDHLIFLMAESMSNSISETEYLDFCRSRGGNEAEYLCMHCAHQARRDPRRDSMNCPSCEKPELWRAWELEGKRCPKCGQGTFVGRRWMIS